MKQFINILLVLAGCACTRQQTVVYDLEPFECIDITAFGELSDITHVNAEAAFSQQDTYQMVFQKSGIDRIDWYTKNNTLYVWVFSHKKPKLTINAPCFKSIKCFNFSQIKTTDTIKQSCLVFSSIGIKNSDLRFDTDTLILRMDSYKKAKLSGRCDTASIDASAAWPFSDFDARELEINNLQIACGIASTHTWLHVNNHLWITEGMTSKIDYYGNPEIKQADIHFSTLRGR